MLNPRFITDTRWLLIVAGWALLWSSNSVAAEDQWARTLARTADSVVSLQLSQLRNFDDTEQGASTATGFVVDAERGIILTNRHVVGSGPVRISATFQNQEQVDAVPLYRDPVHDFGFVRYDPVALKYARPESMQLRPDKISTGLNIRVIGSDGGEQLSILTGTIARIDREAPSYGRYGYNDFNTFYLQAASSTSGGSSGSPVIDLDGDVVALNAAANARTAASFFLPLHRIKRALENLQQDQPNTRGGFQTLFRHYPFRELRRLGLDEPLEQAVRELDGRYTGMLVVTQVLPAGVADGKLQAGDILVSLDGTVIANYLMLESMLDDRVGQSVAVKVLRQGVEVGLSMAVADLHALMPDRFIEIGNSILQDMSMQHSRAMNLPQSGVVVMRPGFFFEQAGVAQSSVIVELDGEPVESLDDFVDIVRRSDTPDRLLVRYVIPGREFSLTMARLELDNRWFGHRECSRIDDARFWQCEALDLPLDGERPRDKTIARPTFRDSLLDRVAPAMVRVDFHIPYTIDNVYAQHFTGVGILLDREEGLVVVDRNTVPIGLGDVSITLLGSYVTDAEVVFLHPTHNIALVKFDPEELQGTEFQALELAGADTPLPDQVFMVGYRADGTFRKHPVSDMSQLTVQLNAPHIPRFQQAGVDVYGLPNLPPSLGGPLVDTNGNALAIWMSFAWQEGNEITQGEWAMPAEVIAESLRLYRTGSDYLSVDASFSYQPVSLAREIGLPDEWLSRYFELDPNERRVLYVDQILPRPDGSKPELAVGDVLMAIDGELVTDLFALEQRVQKTAVALTVLRQGQVRELSVNPTPVSVMGTDRMVSWAGAVFQQPHEAIARFRGTRPKGVYITDTFPGSPAQWDDLYQNRFVTAVDGIPVSNLDEFLEQVSRKRQDEITRLSLLTLSGREGIVSVSPEYNFWPTFELRREDKGWKRIDHAN